LLRDLEGGPTSRKLGPAVVQKLCLASALPPPRVCPRCVLNNTHDSPWLIRKLERRAAAGKKLSREAKKDAGIPKKRKIAGGRKSVREVVKESAEELSDLDAPMEPIDNIREFQIQGRANPEHESCSL
jgi:hypothetical protein